MALLGRQERVDARFRGSDRLGGNQQAGKHAGVLSNGFGVASHSRRPIYHFERYEGLEQDEIAICTFPDGTQGAWFRGAEENTLSVTEPDR